MSTIPLGRRGHWHGWARFHRPHGVHRASAAASREPTTMARHERLLIRARLTDGTEVAGTDRALPRPS